jgi:exopolyphosphatase/guanosine-5'-triphosphate,3'-diphosphate pyrophosphatase
VSALKRRDRAGSFSGNAAERAIIDIGSNSVRLVVYGGTMRAPVTVLNEKVVAQLGREIATTGRLPEDSIELAMRGIRRFALLLEDLGVEDVETVATAAAREADNGPHFLEQVRAAGFEPRLLSGEEEAGVSADGVIGAFPGAAGVVADLGGGSLELVKVSDEMSDTATSLPLGTLRLKEYREQGDTKPSQMRKRLMEKLRKSGWGKPVNSPLYLVGGTWRALAVYAMNERKHPLTDPHAFELDAKEATLLARRVARATPEKLAKIPRLTSTRAAVLPDAAVLLQALLKQLAPTRVIFSSWGLREGLLYGRLEPHRKAQDPLLAGVSYFVGHRGAPPQLAARIAGWTVEAVPTGTTGTERVRLAATMLTLASIQIEPNLRTELAIDWALHKRWVAIDAASRAQMAATVAANCNELSLPKSLSKLASPEALEEAVCWGLAIRLARRVGARSRKSFQVSRLMRDETRLILRLQESHRDLYGIPVEKDLGLLADRLGLQPHVEIVPDDTVWDSNDDGAMFDLAK